jgi:hypothetical protein
MKKSSYDGQKEILISKLNDLNEEGNIVEKLAPFYVMSRCYLTFHIKLSKDQSLIPSLYMKFVLLGCCMVRCRQNNVMTCSFL